MPRVPSPTITVTWPSPAAARLARACSARAGKRSTEITSLASRARMAGLETESGADLWNAARTRRSRIPSARRTRTRSSGGPWCPVGCRAGTATSLPCQAVRPGPPSLGDALGWLGRRPLTADPVDQVASRLTNLLGQPAILMSLLLVGRQAVTGPVQQRGECPCLLLAERDLTSHHDSFLLRLWSALVGADEGAAGQLLALQGTAQVVGRCPGHQSQGRRGCEDLEEVPVRTIPDRRHGAAVAFFSEVVAALHGRGWMLPFGQPGRGRLEPGQHPVNEGATRGVGVLAEDSQLGSLLRHPSHIQGRWKGVMVLGMVGRDRLVVTKGRATQLDPGHVSTAPGLRPAS